MRAAAGARHAALVEDGVGGLGRERGVCMWCRRQAGWGEDFCCKRQGFRENSSIEKCPVAEEKEILANQTAPRAKQLNNLLSIVDYSIERRLSTDFGRQVRN